MDTVADKKLSVGRSDVLRPFIYVCSWSWYIYFTQKTEEMNMYNGKKTVLRKFVIVIVDPLYLFRVP